MFADNEFGQRVQRRLREETLIWLTTVSADGTPQPNPVWFLWDGDESVLVYNANDAVRLSHVAVRPRVSLHLQAGDGGDDVVVIAGVAEQALDVGSPAGHEKYLAKYRDGIGRIGSSVEKFDRDYSVPLRIRFTKVRGF